MTLADDVDLEEFVHAKDELSGADIQVCVCVCVCVKKIFFHIFFFGYLSHPSLAGRVHRGGSAGFEGATHESDSQRLQESEGEGALPQERRSA